MSKEINFNNLIYYSKNPKLTPINFVDFKGPKHIYNNIENGETSIEKIEEDKKKIKSKLYEITTGNLKHRVKDQSDAIKNINNIYSSRKKVFK